MLLLASCTIDLNRQEPYFRAIGKQFVLQQDLYIYYFNDYNKYPYLVPLPCKLYLGTTAGFGSLSYDLPEKVEEKYIGSKNSYFTLLGILSKGTVMSVKRIVEHKTLDNSYTLYIVSPNQGSFENQEIDSFGICDFSNPPFTKTWSDPPIFKAEYALPLPSDGVWWK